MARRRTRGYAGVNVGLSGVHPYAGVRSGCLSCSCVLVSVLLVGVPALLGGVAVAVWR